MTRMMKRIIDWQGRLIGDVDERNIVIRPRHRRPDRRIELKEYIHQNSGFTGIPTHSFSVAVVLPLLLIGPPSRHFTHRLLCYIICQSRLARPSRPFLLCTAWWGPVFSTSRQGFSLYFPSVGLLVEAVDRVGPARPPRLEPCFLCSTSSVCLIPFMCSNSCWCPAWRCTAWRWKTRWKGGSLDGWLSMAYI